MRSTLARTYTDGSRRLLSRLLYRAIILASETEEGSPVEPRLTEHRETRDPNSPVRALRNSIAGSVEEWGNTLTGERYGSWTVDRVRRVWNKP